MQERQEWSGNVSSAGENSTNLGEMTDQAKQQVGEMTDQAKQKAGETFDQVKQQAQAKLDQQKQQAADQLSGVAGALRQTSHNLETEHNQLAQYADSFAEQVDKMSNYLRERDLSELFNDVSQIAKRQPELFVAGALAAGFLLGRFLKSSGSGSNGGYAQRQYTGGGQYTGETRSNYNYAYGNEYGNRTGSRSTAYATPGTSRTNWQGEPFTTTQEIPVTGEGNDAGE
ncbi:MAG TPA: hypothetical protein PKE45_15020 [Caldilineaceae bacterium]|nr:hypothetical protein [Caldilineaceae bacterium]